MILHYYYHRIAALGDIGAWVGSGLQDTPALSLSKTLTISIANRVELMVHDQEGLEFKEKNN